MRATFLCNLIPGKTGAFEQFVAAAGRECAARGHRLDLVFADEPSPAVAELFRHAGLSWRVIRGWSDAADRVNSRAFLAQAPRIVRALSPDVRVVHFGNELPSLAVAATARVAGCRTKWVWQQHQQVADPGPLARRVSRLRVLAALFDHFIAVYDGGRRSLRLRGIPERKISVVYNGIVDHVPARRRCSAKAGSRRRPEMTAGNEWQRNCYDAYPRTVMAWPGYPARAAFKSALFWALPGLWGDFVLALA